MCVFFAMPYHAACLFWDVNMRQDLTNKNDLTRLVESS